ncbi:hypothetical protein RFI_32702 [Reticulomyxa filosa]|uniref:Uncharacterized protein n=1 Tax=Reticulomyxa filosa TaxID=46433 RepID=X6LTI3_RETFI|nr:hypothetical protein RFI_32702 [Reticulomyxa filosa]|eukprot:ETO04696.1 hypothetical protein RFI_32702 [Reticulomyxa filosa]
MCVFVWGKKKKKKKNGTLQKAQALWTTTTEHVLAHWIRHSGPFDNVEYTFLPSELIDIITEFAQSFDWHTCMHMHVHRCVHTNIRAHMCSSKKKKKKDLIDKARKKKNKKRKLKMQRKNRDRIRVVPGHNIGKTRHRLGERDRARECQAVASRESGVAGEVSSAIPKVEME